MKLRRVHFTGAAGSGTTTLGRALAARAHLKHFETDDYLWLPSEPPYQRMRIEAERQRLLLEDLAGLDGWVLSGSLARWGEPIEPRFQLVVFVVTPTDVRLARLRERELERFGGEALAPGGAMHRHHLEFMAWAAQYDHGDESVRSRQLHERWLSRLTCRVVRVDGGRPVAPVVDELVAELGN